LKTWLWLGIGLFLLANEGTAQTIMLKDSLRRNGTPVVVSDSLLTAAGDSISLKKKTKKFVPNPRLATKLALIPGGGQFYNRDYWKLGLVYAAMAGGTWTALYWNVRYKDFVKGYFTFYEGADKKYVLKADHTVDKKRPIFYRGGILNGERVDSLMLTIDQVKRVKNSYRRYKGLSIIATGLIYSISIIEANVAAHLKTFDLSDDLTMRIEPKVYQPMINQPTAQLRLVFNFK
jgi:hypothetical protein